MSHADTVVFGTTTIEYAVQRRNRRKTIAITVRPDRSVSVAAPTGIRRALIASKVREKAEWVVRQQERLRQNARHAAKKGVSGESFRYLGRQYQLKVQRRPVGPAVVEATMSRGCLVVRVGRRWSTVRRREAVQQALVSWYREKANAQIRSAVQRFAARLGVTVKAIQVREMKTRWGSGGPDAQVRFNWRIVMAPKRLLEYVVAHELCHIRHHDHSREFWRLLGRVMPDYGQRRHELEKLGPALDVC
jgi:predicted metal-dependent hydrolase